MENQRWGESHLEQGCPKPGSAKKLRKKSSKLFPSEPRTSVFRLWDVIFLTVIFVTSLQWTNTAPLSSIWGQSLLKLALSRWDKNCFKKQLAHHKYILILENSKIPILCLPSTPTTENVVFVNKFHARSDTEALVYLQCHECWVS